LLLFESVMGGPYRAGLDIAVVEEFAELCPSRLGYAENAQSVFPPKEVSDVFDQGLFDGANRSPIKP
jgi:hypothetical protein